MALSQCEAAIFDFREQQAGWIGDVREAPTFRPSREEFADPLAYIASIQTKAAKYGEHPPPGGWGCLLSGLAQQLECLLWLARDSDCRCGSRSMHLLAGICKIVPPMGAALPASLVRRPSYRVIAQLVPQWPSLTASCCTAGDQAQPGEPGGQQALPVHHAAAGRDGDRVVELRKHPALLGGLKVSRSTSVATRLFTTLVRGVHSRRMRDLQAGVGDGV